VNERHDADGALWVLFPLTLNRNATSRPEEVLYLPSFEDDLAQNYSTLNVEKNPQNGVMPIAVIAARNNARIQAQLGAFTISHANRMALERIGKGEHLIKYTIPAACKQDISRELRMLGMSRFQLFPELPSVGSMIREDLG